MASFDYRLNPLYAIKECSSCGAFYTTDYYCSKGSLVDKIIRERPPQNCATCGDPVDGLYCRPCAFVRKCLNEGWYTIHDENEILNTSESSNDNTNIVSAPQEPFVFNQDPGKNSSQSPPHIDHHCCYECGDSLDDIFCQRCTHTNVSKSIRNEVLNEWVIDSFDVEVDFGKTRDDPYSTRFKEYKEEFENKIKQLANKYDLRVRRQRYALDDVWEKCEKFHDTVYQWHDV
ncbi:hypothetical protein Tco_1175329 [Tanacetum coccineum]